MTQYDERVLGREALEWVQNCLRGTTLGEALTDQLPLTGGWVTTMVPDYVSPEEANAFESGIRGDSALDPFQLLVAMAKDHLRLHTDRLCPA